MNLSEVINFLPRMKSGNKLLAALEVLPEYNNDICFADVSTRLMALSDIYKIYIPSQMSLEIYSKLYLALLRSMQKKGTKLAIQQRNQNYKAIIQQEYSGIIGGSDSFTIIGTSGIGKSSAISRAITLITENKVIETKNPYTNIALCIVVQCPFDSSVKGLLLEILRKVDEILDTKSYTGNEGDKVTLEEKTIDGYVISQRPEVTEVTLTPTSQEVTYYYKKQVTTEVIGIDANSKEEIYKDVVDGIEGDSYTATAKNLQGYQLVGRPQTETVTMDRNVSKVIYTYKKVSHGVTIKYVDDYSGEILDQETITGLENDSYTSETKEYEKYDFVRIEGNANGNMTVNPIEVIYHYEKKTGIVEVIYVDEEGNELFVETMEDKVDNEYKVEEKEVKNYRVKEYPENLEGIYELEKQTVTYIMEKIPGKVIVNLKDEEGNIMKVLEGNGYVGEEYEIELPEIEGYFIDGEKILKVAYEDGEVVVDVIYNKVPETGDINVVINLAILILSVAVVTKKLFNFACNIK